ncbi:MAG: hypothetical protein PHO26_07385 [Dehalococcoidia bacterium]|nr:hypothetical protein [Dehalococcoidia bacterium]MDD5494948.1 hypothetical protein [Dehalococcoidia bacterium]
MKHLIREILARTFSRMTTYLSIFNFCMLCAWLYESDLGGIFKDNGLRPGDVILIVLFTIIVVSSIEMAMLGFEENE